MPRASAERMGLSLLRWHILPPLAGWKPVLLPLVDARMQPREPYVGASAAWPMEMARLREIPSGPPLQGVRAVANQRSMEIEGGPVPRRRRAEEPVSHIQPHGVRAERVMHIRPSSGLTSLAAWNLAALFERA